MGIRAGIVLLGKTAAGLGVVCMTGGAGWAVIGRGKLVLIIPGSGQRLHIRPFGKWDGVR